MRVVLVGPTAPAALAVGLQGCHSLPAVEAAVATVVPSMQIVPLSPAALAGFDIGQRVCLELHAELYVVGTVVQSMQIALESQTVQADFEAGEFGHSVLPAVKAAVEVVVLDGSGLHRLR